MTFGSLRISSRIASLMACAKVNSRASFGVDMLGYLLSRRKRRVQGEFHALCDLLLHFLLKGIKLCTHYAHLNQPVSQAIDRIPILPPLIFLVVGTIRTVAVAHPVTIVSI